MSWRESDSTPKVYRRFRYCYRTVRFTASLLQRSAQFLFNGVPQPRVVKFPTLARNAWPSPQFL